MKKLASIIIFGVFIIGIAGSESDEEKAANDQKVADSVAEVTVTAVTLLADYEANELAFEGKYVDKILVVTGTINDVGRALGSLSVSFTAGEDTLNQVVAYFSEAQKSALAKLNKGQAVKVKCRCNGVSLGVVMLSNCSVQ